MCNYQIFSIIGLFFPGLVVIALWFFDLRKRLDPLIHELYRQKMAAYQEIIENLWEVLDAVAEAGTKWGTTVKHPRVDAAFKDVRRTVHNRLLFVDSCVMLELIEVYRAVILRKPFDDLKGVMFGVFGAMGRKLSIRRLSELIDGLAREEERIAPTSDGQ